MATSVPTPGAKRSTKGEPPARAAAPGAPGAGRGNLTRPQPQETVGLNFKVQAEFKRDFKIEAAMRGLKQVELLQAMFALWRQHKGQG